MRRFVLMSGVVIVTAALALSACGGGSDSTAKTPSAGSTSIVGPTGAAGSGGAARAATAAHGASTATTKARTGTTTPHGATTATVAATTTTINNTIKPLPGRPGPPVFDYSGTYAVSASPITVNGTQYGVCRGPDHFTTVMVTWATVNTDYVQINGDHSRTFPAFGHEEFMPAKCDENHGPLANPQARVQFVLFGPGGEWSTELSVKVDRNYQP